LDKGLNKLWEWERCKFYNRLVSEKEDGVEWNRMKWNGSGRGEMDIPYFL
jgi:hypothetical protein